MQIQYLPIFSGSSGNCALLATGGARLLVDAGRPCSAILQQLERVKFDPSSLDGILITHEHVDHVRGAGVLSRKFDLPVYATAATFAAMERSSGPISPKNARVIYANCEFSVGNVGVLPVPVPHDAADPVGYVLRCGGRAVAQITDLGHMPKELLAAAAEADLVVLESNHDVQMLKTGPYPAALKARILGRRGHLSNDSAAEAAIALADAGVGTIVLGHLSAQNNREVVAYRAVRDALDRAGMKLGPALRLDVALRDRPTTVYDLSV